MTRQSRIIAWLVTAIICVFSTSLFAETKGFQEYLDAAKEAYDKKDYDNAIKNLLLANSVENNARLLFNIAKSYQKLESCDKAIVYFTAFRRQPTAGAKLREQALAEIEKSRSCQTVKPLAGRFFIKSDPVGATVIMDGVDIGVTPLEVAGYKSGAHDINFSLEGYQKASQSFEALAGNDQLVSQQLVASEVVDTKEKIVKPPVVSEPSAPEGNDNLIPLIIAGSITTVGAGVLGFAIYTDTVTIVDLKDERSKLDLTIPNEAEDSEELTEDIDDAITTSLVSYVIGGTLMTGGAAYLIYLLAFDSTDAGDDIVIAPSVNAHGYGISFSSTF